MEEEVSSDTIDKFLTRVMEIEENYAFARKGQESSRKEEIKNLLEDILE